MEIRIPGHCYFLQHKEDNTTGQQIRFVDKVVNKDGITSQEVLRALIDRSKFVEGQLSHPNNKRILYHLRQALILHESRALERKVDKGMLPEHYPVGADGHFIIHEPTNV